MGGRNTLEVMRSDSKLRAPNDNSAAMRPIVVDDVTKATLDDLPLDQL
jgi:hypothetical protein